MKNLSELTIEKDLTWDLKNLIEVYEETAAEAMKNMREKIVSGREFLQDLALLSVAIGDDMAKTVSRGSKAAAVFLSADEGLYGSLIIEVFESFLKTIKTEKLTPVVVGETGRQLMSEWAPEIKFNFLAMAESDDVEALTKIKTELNEFARLKVFFARFKNLVKQLPAAEELTGRKVLDVVRDQAATNQTSAWEFIYEPSTASVADKFSREIWHNLFIGLMEEHRLARQAARLMQLDQAIETIDERSTVLNQQIRLASKKIEDKKQQGRLVRLRL